MKRQGSRNKGITGRKVPELAKADPRFGLKGTGSEFILLFIFLKEIKEYSIEMNVIPSLSSRAENATMY